MALTLPRLMPIRWAICRCDKLPSRSIRTTSCTTVVAIMVSWPFVGADKDLPFQDRRESSTTKA